MEPLRLAYTGGLADARHNANKESGGKNIRRWPGADETKKGGGRRRRGKNEWLDDGMMLERTAKRLEFGCLGQQSLWLHRRHAVTVLQGVVIELELSFSPRLIEKTSSRESICYALPLASPAPAWQRQS